MKKFTTFLFALCLASGVSTAWSEIKLTTSLEPGSDITFYLPTPVASDGKVIVDWGDSVQKEYIVDGMITRNISGTQVGDTIRILSPMRSFDCSDSHITSISIVNEPELTTLDCYRNEIERTNLDISGALNLETLNCHNNPKLMFLNLSEHKKLRILDCRYDRTNTSDPDDRGAITTIILPSEGGALESITAYDNDLSAIDLSGCPNLYYVNLEGNSLMEIDVTKLPELQQLDVRYNYIQSLDLTKNEKLEKLFCNDNHLTELNVFINTELMDLVCSNNQIKSLDLSANGNITNLSCDGNQLTKLNVSNMPRLKSLKCGNNQLTEIDLSQNSYLEKFWGQNNRFTFLDFYYNQGINTIDIRNNAGMTPCSLNFMYQTLSGLEKASPNTNLWLEGSNAETSDTSLATELKWTVDVTGDGSATCGTVTATLIPSEMGTFTLSQPDLVSHELHAVENNTLESGVPTYITASPAEGYQLRYYEVNGQRINGNIFVATENVTVAAVFVPIADNNYIAIGVKNNTPLSFGISGIDPETEVEIDWGNGEIETIIIDNESITRLDGNSKGTTVKISGLIDYFDCSENELTSLDVTHNATLATLDCYWNYITTLDLSNNPELAKLNCSYNEIGTLDLSANTELERLFCDGNQLDPIDLSSNTKLNYLQCADNGMTACELNDLFYHLPVCASTPTNANLFIAGISDKANEAETSETSIASKKGWKPSIDGDGSGCDVAYITIEPSENGSLELRNADNLVVNSGDKVAKNTTVTITALPDEGYALRNAWVNGVAISNNSFVVKMASVVTAEFADASGIDETETNGVKVWSQPGVLKIEAEEAQAQVYTTSGSLVWEGRVINQRDLDLNQGIYIVKVHNASSTQSKKVVVK